MTKYYLSYNLDDKIEGVVEILASQIDAKELYEICTNFYGGGVDRSYKGEKPEEFRDGKRRR